MQIWTLNRHLVILKAYSYFFDDPTDVGNLISGSSAFSPKPLTVWITINCGKFLEMGMTDHLTCLLRDLYAGQEATVRTGHGTTDWFQIEKGVHRGCVLLPCLFNLYAEYIMRNTRLNDSQSGIKNPGGNINNLRYADDTPLWKKKKN